MIVTLADVKTQLRIDHADDDALLEAKIAAAQQHIERLLGYAIEATYGGDEQDAVPEPLREAVLQLVGAWDQHREATTIEVSVEEVPFSIADIVREYRLWSF